MGPFTEVSAAAALSKSAEPISRDQIRFRSVGVREGLSSTTARAMAQDEKGFVWLGTQDGLNRFDGYSFRLYRADSERADSLSDSHISALAADGKGTLWIGTQGGGVNRMDLVSEHVERFLEGGPSGLIGTQVNALTIARDGALWTATHDGAVQRLRAGDARFETVLPQEARLRRVRSLLELPQGDWLLGGDSGLMRYSPATRTLREWRLPQATNGWSINALVAAPDGRIFAGDNTHGLLEWSGDGRLLAHHRAGANTSGERLISDQIISLMVTSQGELWVGTLDGLSRYQGDGRFLNFVQDATDIGSIAANRIPSMMEDRDGLLWFGTWTAGVSLHKPATRALRLIRHRASDPRSIPTNPTRALIQDQDGTLWFGLLEGGGLVHYDLQRGVLRRYRHDPKDPESLPGDGVYGILRRKNGELWVATSAGVARLNASGDGFVRAENAPLRLPTRASRVLYETRDGTLWIGTMDVGLLALPPNGAPFAQYTVDPAHPERSLPGSNINGLFEDRSGQLWVGMNGTGLVRLDRGNGTVTVVRARRGEKEALQSDVLTTFLETRDGELWIGTQGGGISRVERQGETLKFFNVTQRDGLSANAIGSVVEDLDGMLWVSSIGGIDQYDQRTGHLRALTASDGFDRSGYFIGSNAQDDAGNLYFGGLLGVVKFHPRDFQLDRRPPEVVLTSVDIYSEHARHDAREATVAYLKELRLDHKEPVWALNFSTMNYANVETVRFSYRLEGLSDRWVVLTKGQRMASFTSVPPGSYVFRVRAANADGLEYGPETRLPIAIAPPPWWSLGAKLLYAAGVALILALLTRSMRRRSRERAQAVQAIAEREHRLQLALWGSRDELWDLDLRTNLVRRENPLPNVERNAQDEPVDLGHFIALMHPEDRAAADQAMRAHMRGETEYCEMAYRGRGLDGNWFWVLTRGQVVERDPSGRPLRMIGTHRDITTLKAAEEALRASKEALESRVVERTAELTATNTDLQQTLAALQKAQEQLIESEKMASLGGLVAGVAHEINTPLGVGITAASHLEAMTQQFAQRIKADRLSAGELSQYLGEAMESSRLILKNLERAGQLVRSFKQVAVDQGSEERRIIRLDDYLKEIAFALRPALKHAPHELRIDCAPGIVIDTYPGAVYQIVVNLISNALAHAFPSGQAGLIELSARLRRDETSAAEEIVLEYQDNGAGVEPAVLKRIFDPFFTTNRNQGGSGLGLHIVYNRVTQLLGGTITVENRNGLHFVIRWPVPKREPRPPEGMSPAAFP